MFQWCSNEVGEIFRRKNKGDGWVEIQFPDVKIRIDVHPSDPRFPGIWLALPEIARDSQLFPANSILISLSDTGEIEVHRL